MLKLRHEHCSCDMNFVTHRIVSFVGLSFSEKWKHHCSPDCAIEPLGSWRNVLSGNCRLRWVLTDFQTERSEISLELKVISGYCDVLLLR